MAHILLADDEPLFAVTTAQFLQEHGHKVICRPSGRLDAFNIRSQHIDVVIADLDMPGNRELELLNYCRGNHPDIPFIIVTGRPTLPSAIEGIKLGIHDYFLKPLELDDLLHSVGRALQLPAASQHPSEYHFADMLGNSAAMTQLKEQADRIAQSQATVLITGESGTGKELLARAIHRRSRRWSKPFVTVDCTTIPEPLMESTLFGHTRGAFTGADKDRSGLILQADGGTLFLDEIGELPLALQAKLLRVIQFGSYLPVGSTRESKVDIRILAATHRDLRQEVQEGSFRLDLYYRMSVLAITSPPLRERAQDIPLLAKNFLETIARRDGAPKRLLSENATNVLLAHTWPGNVRELQNVMERCACLASTLWISDNDVASCLDLHSPVPKPTMDTGQRAERDTIESLHVYRGLKEREYLAQLLEAHNGNVARAARAANISRQGFHKALQRAGLSAGDYRS